MAQGKKCTWTLGITGIKAAKCLQKEVSPNVNFSLDCLFFTML